MTRILFPVVLLLVNTFGTLVFGANILVLYPACSKSHKISVMPILEELALRGHQITIVSPYALSIKVQNIHEIVLPFDESMMSSKENNFFEMSKKGPTFVFSLMINFMTRATRLAYETMMENQEFRKILEDRKVDLVIYNAMFNEFSAIIANYLKVPYITHNSGSGFPSHLALMGAPKEYASVPSVLTNFDDRMTFFQRMINMIQAEMFDLVYNYFVVGLMEELACKDFPESCSISQLQNGISLTIVNSHPTTAWPRSLPPTVIPIGALQTGPPKPLPEDFDKFAAESKDGFVVFTLGSAVPVSSMPKENLETFIKVFAKLKQKVIWKWEDDKLPENLSKNVMTSKWLPQQDLLGHPNARVFITHGGLQGTQEAIYHSVPLLCLPFGNDQIANAKKASREGFGISLDWNTLNEDTLYDALTLLISDPTYKENASRLSGLMRDEPMPGREVAAYWVEHVLRHGGTKHLQTLGKNMPFYQQNLLDVFAFLILLSLIVIFIGYRFIRWVVSLCFRQQKTPKSKKN